MSATNNSVHTPAPDRWRTLFVIAIAQLMVVLDASIVNIAIPSAKADLGITDANQQWVVTAYTLAFGSLLLLGGRIADFVGRKKIFIIGLLGFAAASAIGGIASTQGLLFASRQNSISPTTGGSSTLLYAVGAAVIGGTSLFGGKGKLRDAILGGLVVAVIDNGMGLLGYPAGIKFIVTGAVLLVSAGVDAISRRGVTSN